MKKNLLILLILFSGYFTVSAQEMGYGFKAGLNFSNFQGPSEQDSEGTDLENTRLITGFHIGAIINFKFTDLVGLRTEIMFSQKGSRYSFNGDSYEGFFVSNGDNLFTTGQKEISLNITNAYIDIPVMGYFRATNWLELSAGASVGYMVSSVGAGEMRYTGTTANGVQLEEVVVGLDYTFFNDDGSVADVDNSTIREISGLNVLVPKTKGAYYNRSVTDNGTEDIFFNKLDLGLVGGINLFLNQGLSLGLRANYGLNDITRNTEDPSKSEIDGQSFIYNNEKDSNLSLQVSIGFSF